MLTVVPQGWLSRDLTVLERDQPVAHVRFAWPAGTAELAVGDTTYAIRQAFPRYGPLILKGKEGVVARAREIRTFFYHSPVILVDFASRQLELETKSLLRRRLAVRESVQFVGYIEPEHLFSRRLQVCLPENVPLAVRVFIIAVVVLLATDRPEVM